MVSLAVGWQLASALAAALGARPPASRLELDILGLFQPYHELVNQGTSHRYYAPEPAPTPLVIARLRMEDGRERELRIPDRTLWPRLRYQRHLALANYLAEESRIARAERRGSIWGASYARHLCAANPGCAEVTLLTQYHLIPSPGEILEQLEHGDGRPVDVDAEEYFSVPDHVGDYPCRP